MTRTFIIAEAGVNHNGNVDMAHRLVDVAKAAGADAVKFQTWSTELVMRRDTPLVDYQKKTEAETMFDLCKALELSFDDFIAIKRHCNESGIQFLSTAFDTPSMDFLVSQLNVALIKVPSGEAVNVPLLRHAARTGLPVILSTGMCTLDEVALAIDTLAAIWGTTQPELTLLHCTTAYPTPPEETHLNAMATLRDRFHRAVGLSDHTEGFLAPVAAVALGAVVIEKHFTLDRSLPGPDHAASVDPVQLEAMVKAIRTTEAMLGNAEKVTRTIERDTVRAVRRALVATRDIAVGELLMEEDLIALRPEDGIPARDIDQVVGRSAWQAFRKGEVLKWPA